MYCYVMRWVALKFAGALHGLYVSLFTNFQLKQIAVGYWVLLETRVGTRSRNSPYCMEHEGPLPYAQELTTCKLSHVNAVHPLPSWQWPRVTFHRISHSVVGRFLKARRFWPLAQPPSWKITPSQPFDAADSVYSQLRFLSVGRPMAIRALRSLKGGQQMVMDTWTTDALLCGHYLQSWSRTEVYVWSLVCSVKSFVFQVTGCCLNLCSVTLLIEGNVCVFRKSSQRVEMSLILT